MTYSEHSYVSTSTASMEDESKESGREGTSLAAVWEHIVKTKSLPDGLNLDDFFRTIHERLRNPEWEVRQHSLRLLADTIPLIPANQLEYYVSSVLNSLIANLGHLGPAVRKGAIDSLRAYIKCTQNPDEVIVNLIDTGVDRSQENRVQNNVVLGIIISIPYILNNKLKDDTLLYTIHKLLDKIVKVVHQETVVKSLLRIKEVVGKDFFDFALTSHPSYNSLKDFEMLCEVYDLRGFKFTKRKDSEELRVFNYDEDKVILETEIKLDSGSAITMKIHEEKIDEDNCATFQVLPDDEEPVRRTPRRVRFGGEIVKLRTPDSDSNLQSDSEVIRSDGDSTVQIEYIEKEIKTTKSLIPVPIKQTRSAPSSPARTNLKKSKVFRSSPNIQSPKVYTRSRIPIKQGRTVETQIQIRIHENPKKKCESESLRRRNLEKMGAVRTRRNSREDEFSPTPIHHEIQVLHNLTRSPSPSRGKPVNKFEEDFKKRDLKVDNVTVNSENEAVNSFITFPTDVSKTCEEEKRSKKPALPKEPKAQNIVIIEDSVAAPIEDNYLKVPAAKSKAKAVDEFKSFHVCQAKNESPILNKDGGDCLTCSSSGSDADAWSKSTSVEGTILEDLQNTDDLRSRLRALERLNRISKTPEGLEVLEGKLAVLLGILFTAEQQPLLQNAAEQIFDTIFSNVNQQILQQRLHQICLSLSRLGSPNGIRLAILLMKRIPPGLLVDQLLTDAISGAKSSKVREGALQILMTISRIYPSTEINIPKATTVSVLALKDKKRKVRQAALETLATLAQISSTKDVLTIADQMAQTDKENEEISKILRIRLSRKQLPTVHMNGVVRYSTPQSDCEIHWLCHGSNGFNNLDESGKSRRRFYSAQNTEKLTNWRRDKISSATYNTKESSESESNSDHQRFVNVDRFINVSPSDNWKQDLKLKRLQFSESKQETECLTSSRDTENCGWTEGEKPSFWINGVENGESIERKNTSEETDSVSSGSNQKVNYWRINKRHHSTLDEGDSDWSQSIKEDPLARTSTTQVWAIDPSVFGTAEKVSTTNGTLHQMLIVNGNATKKTASTNTTAQSYREGATNTSPIFKRRPRGRSFSPPEPQTTTSRFNGVMRWQSAESEDYEQIRKSYSSDHLTARRAIQRDTESASSSSSSMRQPGNWYGDFRSGIPVPVAEDRKFRIRHRKTQHRHKGPMTIPYRYIVKSPSPLSTPEKIIARPEQDNILDRQPQSSGSESSGYFTPPPEPEIEERAVTPLSSPKESTPVISLQSTPSKDNSSDITPIPSPIESPKRDVTPTPSPKHHFPSQPATPKRIFKRHATSTSLDELASTIKPNPLSAMSSFDAVDFTHITFSEHRELSKSEVDIIISTQVIRKTTNSAPSLNEIPKTSQEPEPVLLPGSIPDPDPEPEPQLEQEPEVIPEPEPEPEIQEVIVQQPKPRSLATVSAKKSLSYRRKCKSTNVNVVSDHVCPFAKPKEALNEVISQLESTEWETTMKGLQDFVRLIKFHKELVENNMHNLCVLLSRHIRNLRSQVARSACLVTSELFSMSRRPVELELDELASALLHRTADTNKFLRTDANAALDNMIANLSIPKVVNVISHRGCNHQNAVVRCASARLLCHIVSKLGAEKIFQLPRDTRDKILLAGANLLMEGSLETRKHSKMLLGQLSGHSQFQKALTEAVPSSVLRHIDKTLRTIM
ncbi:PREDICTED: uncharacterized protein LOC108565142 [Nicrophorus vespilloides]|uniref:Uncharacterized protein LOC108565142 n=1 Tax=Nicrophorus vespilloides TaxID=110193 RepID=A0ABM1MZC0_NICVS|nr:PREDICTED: uncharacterized protein LOC108565142 [Nicrophorus vespilloides]